MTHIAILGTGLLGAAFAEASAKRGDTVTAWNRSTGKAQALAVHGVAAAATPAEAVRGAARVHLVLRDDAVVEEVIAAARPGLRADTILVDHSTTLPAATTARAQRYAAQGLNYLHCPVFMGPQAARDAQGSMMASGPRVLFERVEPELAKMTGRLTWLGERPDLAAVNKLMGNATLIGLFGVVADVFAMARESGVAPQDALRLFELFDIKAILALRGANMAKGVFTPASFELAMARKDVGLMIESVGTRPLAALPGIAARMDQLIAAGHGANDTGVLAIDTAS
jgi:3-hydroxyisobutyrate dehydrogenase